MGSPCTPLPPTSSPILAALCSTGVLATTDVNEACQGVDIAVMVGGFPRKVL